MPKKHLTAEDLPAAIKALKPGEKIWLEECGCCGWYHLPGFAGDCRDDLERFPEEFLPNPKFDLAKHLKKYGGRTIPFNDPRSFR